jgi:ring-1,2-phenylacetyl-CoA epoxidase subunit PaaE
MLRFHELKLADRSAAADDAVHLTLAVPDELRNAYVHEPGQHIALRVLIDGQEHRRTYSIVSPPGTPGIELGLRVQPGGIVSNFLAERMRVGDSIEVLTPNGSFHPVREPSAGAARRRHCVAFAAGSGISPVICIAASILEREPASTFQLFYGNTSVGRTMFLEEIMALKNRYLARFSVHFVMSRELQDLDVFNGRLDAAKVRALARGAFLPAEVDEYFLCGPGTMIDDIRGALEQLGVRGRIHVEHFTPLEETRSATAPAAAPSVVSSPAASTAAPRVATPAAPGGDAEQLATVTVVMDGRRRTFPVTAADEFILDAAGRAGLDLPFSCRAGVCSTCRAKLVRGTVNLDNNVALEDWELEAGYILCCQARPTSPDLEISYDE